MYRNLLVAVLAIAVVTVGCGGAKIVTEKRTL